MLNQFIRYIHPTRFILEKRLENILEVGSGTQGIGPYIRKRFVGLDSDFRDYAGEKIPLHQHMIPIRALAWQLPFRDETFDCVLCLDTLEHVEESRRNLVVSELIRVSKRHVIVGFPSGAKAFEYDEKLYKYYKRKRKEIPIWLEEHIRNGFPPQSAISDMLAKNGLKCISTKNDNVKFHYINAILEQNKYLFVIPFLIYKIFSLLLLRKRSVGLICKTISIIDRGEFYREILYVSKKL
jgi:ubiquinone/menaquinone biosynthesis C-methylase UbiE